MTTTQLRPAVTTAPGPVRPVDARPSVAASGTGLAPPEPATSPTPPRSLPTRWRAGLRRARRFLLSTADDCPPMLLRLTQRN
ncbi:MULTISPECIES: DUF1178 family protein [Micromonospora]|uniref:Uncharacterized protein n=1 Tax=Micromonospora yangpuensis TaxID=683228 RepID=A0A1C6UA89_9ACTN|nr:DUF1178 family protein [Micromonospora yangpuensis]GGL87969.1 hypothetical protein GCM10012279_02110 [Micromonospora yangpuensis]SCL50821.1 hypothetical protein GA0070617_1605 [Micromonospora yangpuensis]